MDTIASTKHALRAIAARWIALTDEIDAHDVVLDAITLAAAPTLRQAFGIGPDSAAEMMIVAGDNPTRIRSESAFARRGLSDSSVERCDESPPRASSQCRALSHRHRPHALAQPTRDYVARRTLQGLSKKDILRCLKRFVAREAYNGLTIGRAPWSKTQPDRQVTFLTYRGNAVMESFFSTVKSELREHFESNGEAKMELFDDIEVF